MKNIPKFRIQKLISQSGVASRRKAEALVELGKVFINGKKAKIGDSASFEDKIKVNGKFIKKKTNVYFLINKPQGVISTVVDDRNRKTVVDLINTEEYIYPVGRLDYDTVGTMIITNDGELTNRLLHPSRKIKRIYHAKLTSLLTDKELEYLNSDKVFIDSKLSEQIVEHVEKKIYSVVLYEGRHHHVKKIFRLVGKKIALLKRIEFAGLTTGSLSRGKYRNLKPMEVKKLYKLTKK